MILILFSCWILGITAVTSDAPLQTWQSRGDPPNQILLYRAAFNWKMHNKQHMLYSTTNSLLKATEGICHSIFTKK